MGKALWLSLPRYSNGQSKAKERPGIRRQTASRARESTAYRKAVKVWLALPANKFCAGARALGWRRMKATQCHHKWGRRGALLLNQAGWVPVGMLGHQWVDANPARARELGLLCPLGQWNDPSGPSRQSI